MSPPLAFLNAFHPSAVYGQLLDPLGVGQGMGLPRKPSTFTPIFDVYETPTAYILDGELPGLSNKQALRVEFSDNQTLVVEGRVDRPLLPPTSGGEGGEGRVKGVDTHEEEQREKEPSEENAGKKPLQAEAKKSEPSKQQLKVWVTERSVGSFRRVFHLPSPVDTGNVKATLEHGVLRLVVPKKVAEKRQIVIE